MSADTKYGGRAHPKRQNFRRRKYIVDRRRQLATTARVAGLVLVLLLALNAVIAWQGYTVANQIATTNPNVAERLHAANYRNAAILGGISLIIFSMVVVRSIMLTHRTFGAVVKIVEIFERVSDGELGIKLKLRSDDSLKALEKSFNEMMMVFHEKALEDRKSMEQLADEIEVHGNPVDAEMLRRLAAARGKSTK